ncbi:MAG: Fibronectin type domain protein, partial [Solirubrobacterales bacterium]|nr:Fibronectin type domain protein [Solirubrobacterales bacterium]
MRFPPGSLLKWLVPAVACVALATPAAASAALDQGPGGPILVVTGGTDHFGSYYAEILRAEGLNEFDVSPLASVTAATLAAHAVVILGETPVSASEALMLDNWVQAGGDLIAMRPDASLSGLLGLTSAGGTLADSYLKVDTSTAPGAGIVGDTIQYHGAADRYALNGASAVATLYSDASTATANPAVTLRSVGANGGHAAAFAYDLARSVVYTRQGNPAWVGQERDGIAPIRSDDLFFGAASGDPQPDWVDLGKVAIPQADEQQRLLANLIGEIDPAPLPRFWYFPRSAKAVVVMTGDDHAGGGTAGRFDAYAAASAPGCSVADWQCVRSTSYLFNGSPLTDAQAAAYQAAGFEIALHADTGCTTQTQAQFDATLSGQLATFASQYPSAASPVTNRTHCIAWGGWVDPAVVEQQHGIRLDTNYYYWPPNWVQDRPGMFTGSGMPMRFAGLDGSMLDVYQAATQMTDESGQTYPFTADALLSKAVGPQGYYGAFTANMHTDSASSSGSDGILAAAQSRGVPIVSAKQMLTWLDGRNASSFGSIAFTGHTLGFTIAAGSGARGLTAMVPTHSSAGVLSGLQRDGSAATFTTETIKGVDYAFFAADAGAYQATYAPAPSGLTDTTSADFGAGDPGTGTQVVGSGDVILRAGLDEVFDGLALPGGWTSGSWTGGGAAVSGGSLVVDGGWAATTSSYAAGRTLEFDATFGAQPFGHAGFGVDLNNDPDWAMFSTGSDGAQLYARTNGPSATNTPLGAGYLNGAHHFRIDWKPLSVDFFIDGTLVATHNVSISVPMRPIVSDFNSGGAVVSVDRLTLSPPYVASGTFTSRVMDAGATVDFTTLAWTADAPAGTAVAMSARTGDTPTPDGTWTAFAPVASSGDTVGGHARYVQYRAALSTSDSGVTPVLHDVTATYGDTTAPATQIDSGPSGTIAVSSASFAFSSDDGAATFECRLDGGAWGACSSPKAYASLADGSHTFEVRATDAAGNTDQTPALRAFTVSTDTTAPQTQIDSGPSGTIAVSSASFAFSSDDG